MMVAGRSILPVLASVLLLAPRAASQDSVFVWCRVFQDADSSGAWEPGEAFLSGIRLTNGVDVIATDADGTAEFWVDRTQYRFATLTVPEGYWPTTSWYHQVEDSGTGADSADFGLRPLPPGGDGSVRWVHITDTQVQTWGDPNRLDEDLQQINELSERPLFIANTGDLVNVGTDSTHWNNYVAQLAVSEIPVLPVVGNHDVLPTNPPFELYEQYVGPPYFSFEAGNWHFVSYNGDANLANAGTPAQDVWLANDVAARPAGTLLAILQHYMLQETNPAKVAAWEAAGFRACFSGHWHSFQVTERPNGMLDCNLSRTRSGPLDRTPRVFGLVTCTGDGEVRYELCRLGVDHRAEIASPQPDQVVGSEALEIIVQAYDTSSPVATLSAFVSGPGGNLATLLAREGISRWRALLDATSLAPGTYGLSVAGTFADGRPISLSRAFALSDVVPVQRYPAIDWPMFRRTPAGSSFVAVVVEPPLELAWATPVPGMVALNSPVVKDGKVYLGCRAERMRDEAGVLKCDAATGAVEWFAYVPGGVALAPAVVDGVVLVTAMTDSVWALDAATGARRWAVPQVSPRYAMTAPIFEGPHAWVGTEPFPKQIHWSSGAVSWTTPNIGNPWFPYIYSAPAVGPAHVAWGFFGTGDLQMGGLKIVHRATGELAYGEAGCFRSPLSAGTTLYVVGGLDRNDQRLTARTATGSVVWTAAKSLGGGTGSPALGHGVLVVAGRDGAIEAFRASDGANLWTKPVGLGWYDMESGARRVRATPGTPAITDSVVYVASLDGNLYALALGSGQELWRWSLGVPIASSPAVSGNMLFLAAEDEYLYGFVASTPGPPTAVHPPVGRASVFQLHRPSPNPSAGETRFAWTMPDRARCRVRIVDVGGRLVTTLYDGVLDAGEHELGWEGTDARGRRVAPGVYCVQVTAGDRSATRKLVRRAP